MGTKFARARLEANKILLENAASEIALIIFLEERHSLVRAELFAEVLVMESRSGELTALRLFSGGPPAQYPLSDAEKTHFRNQFQSRLPG